MESHPSPAPPPTPGSLMPGVAADWDTLVLWLFEKDPGRTAPEYRGTRSGAEQLARTLNGLVHAEIYGFAFRIVLILPAIAAVGITVRAALPPGGPRRPS
ncbi:hypothetical protein [Streptomyces sp. NPDC048438]|uniref:hypothetical protein n=1 Tax=Streptomyces sp. NPDC048438 TaxID=3365551 RepID=UPI0037148540